MDGHSYLETISDNKRTRILELATELRNFSKEGPQGTQNVSSFLSDVDNQEQNLELERGLHAANTRIREQEEQILALFEAKRQDTEKAQDDVDLLQTKINEINREKSGFLVEYDNALRNEQTATSTLKKQQQQLQIEHSHGEELRTLVLEMLDQAEFWKQRAGDATLWRQRLTNVLGDIEDTNQDVDVTAIRPGQLHTNPWQRDRWTDTALHGDRAAIIGRYEAEIKQLQNKCEKLQRDENRRVEETRKQRHTDSHNQRIVLDLCRKIKYLQSELQTSQEKEKKGREYIRKLERKVIELRMTSIPKSQMNTPGPGNINPGSSQPSVMSQTPRGRLIEQKFYGRHGVGGSRSGSRPNNNTSGNGAFGATFGTTTSGMNNRGVHGSGGSGASTTPSGGARIVNPITGGKFDARDGTADDYLAPGELEEILAEQETYNANNNMASKPANLPNNLNIMLPSASDDGHFTTEGDEFFAKADENDRANHVFSPDDLGESKTGSVPRLTASKTNHLDHLDAGGDEELRYHEGELNRAPQSTGSMRGFVAGMERNNSEGNNSDDVIMSTTSSPPKRGVAGAGVQGRGNDLKKGRGLTNNNPPPQRKPWSNSKNETNSNSGSASNPGRKGPRPSPKTIVGDTFNAKPTQVQRQRRRLAADQRDHFGPNPRSNNSMAMPRKDAPSDSGTSGSGNAGNRFPLNAKYIPVAESAVGKVGGSAKIVNNGADREARTASQEARGNSGNRLNNRLNSASGSAAVPNSQADIRASRERAVMLLREEEIRLRENTFRNDGAYVAAIASGSAYRAESGSPRKPGSRSNSGGRGGPNLRSTSNGSGGGSGNGSRSASGGGRHVNIVPPSVDQTRTNSLGSQPSNAVQQPQQQNEFSAEPGQNPNHLSRQPAAGQFKGGQQTFSKGSVQDAARAAEEALKEALYISNSSEMLSSIANNHSRSINSASINSASLNSNSASLLLHNSQDGQGNQNLHDAEPNHQRQRTNSGSQQISAVNIMTVSMEEGSSSGTEELTASLGAALARGGSAASNRSSNSGYRNAAGKPQLKSAINTNTSNAGGRGNAAQHKEGTHNFQIPPTPDASSSSPSGVESSISFNDSQKFSAGGMMRSNMGSSIQHTPGGAIPVTFQIQSSFDSKISTIRGSYETDPSQNSHLNQLNQNGNLNGIRNSGGNNFNLSSFSGSGNNMHFPAVNGASVRSSSESAAVANDSPAEKQSSQNQTPQSAVDPVSRRESSSSSTKNSSSGRMTPKEAAERIIQSLDIQMEREIAKSLVGLEETRRMQRHQEKLSTEEIGAGGAGIGVGVGTLGHLVNGTTGNSNRDKSGAINFVDVEDSDFSENATGSSDANASIEVMRANKNRSTSMDNDEVNSADPSASIISGPAAKFRELAEESPMLRSPNLKENDEKDGAHKNNDNSLTNSIENSDIDIRQSVDAKVNQLMASFEKEAEDENSGGDSVLSRGIAAARKELDEVMGDNLAGSESKREARREEFVKKRESPRSPEKEEESVTFGAPPSRKVEQGVRNNNSSDSNSRSNNNSNSRSVSGKTSGNTSVNNYHNLASLSPPNTSSLPSGSSSLPNTDSLLLNQTSSAPSSGNEESNDTNGVSNNPNAGGNVVAPKETTFKVNRSAIEGDRSAIEDGGEDNSRSKGAEDDDDDVPGDDDSFNLSQLEAFTDDIMSSLCSERR